MYEAQIAMLYDKLEESSRQRGKLEAQVEELQAQLDTRPADHAGSAPGVPAEKEKAS